MNILERIIELINKEHLGTIITNKSLKSATTLGIGGIAEYWFEPFDEASLVKVVKALARYHLKYFVIGKGSNLIFSDEKFTTLFINLKHLNQIEIESDKITISAGTSACKAGMFLSAKGYKNFEYMALIPGSVGGIIYMNATSFNMGVTDSLLEVTYLTPLGDIKKIILTEDVKKTFAYRKSFFTNTSNIIIKAAFKKETAPCEEIISEIKHYKNKKRESQPLEYRSVGSTFRNFSEIKAWKLIDKVGLRGFRIGDAGVSLKHTNFLINYKAASFQEMISLINLVKTRVKAETGYELLLEPSIITSQNIS